MIDQAWQPRLAEGMVRAYLVEDRVTGFGHQAVNALLPAQDGEPAPQPGPRLYHGPDDARVPGAESDSSSRSGSSCCASASACRASSLPLLWDCDFMFGERAAPAQPERYVLCEINVSSVSPFPPSSIAPLVAATRTHLARV